MILDNNYRIPVIVIGILLALFVVFALLFIILKNVKVEEPIGQTNIYGY